MEVEPSASDESPPRRSQSGAGGVPVYVMLPLDTVSREGELRAVEQLAPRLEALRDAGVEGVMIDVWWGIVERRAPGVYDWAPYVALADVLERLEMKLHVVLSFHACGANRDDDYHVPLPPWVEDAVGRDPDGLLFQDKEGTRSDEYLSLWADDAPMPIFAGGAAADGARQTRDASAMPPGRDDASHQHPPRSPLECYRDLMRAFRATFDDRLRPGGLITEVLVGCGPCGELRFPAYAMSRGWRFPGVGEFQCYDRRARESLARAAAAAGRPEWGKGGPHDAGTYNSRPDETGFFANGVGAPAPFPGPGGTRESALGGFGGIIRGASASAGSNPGGQLLSSRSMLLPTTLAPDSPVAGSLGGSPPGAGADGRPRGDGANPRSWAARTKSLDDLTQEEAGASASAPNGRWDSEYGRFFLGWYSGELAAHGERVMRAAGECFAGCAARLALKCAGIHWWYRTRSHAAELTTGYYNVQGGSEVGNSESAPFAKLGGGGGSGADVRRASVDWVPGGGDRAVPRSRPSFDGLGSPPRGGGLSKNQSLGSFGSIASVDEARESIRGGAGPFGANRPSGYDRVMAVAKSAGASVTFTCAEMSDREHDPEHKCGPEGLMRQVVRCAARHGVDVAAENALYRCDATAFKQMVRNCKRGGGETEGAGMTSFTFLRMCDSLFEERNFREFATFVRDLSGNDGRAGSP